VAVAWQPDGRALAVGTQDGFLQVWRQAMPKGGPRGTNKASQLTMRGYPGKVACLAWHPSRPLIATAGGPDVVLWDLPHTGKGAKGQPLRQHRKTITTLAWSPDGRLLASGDRAGQLCLWNAQGALIFTQNLGHELSAIAWRPDSQSLAVADTHGQLQLFGGEPSDDPTSMTSPDLGGIQ
jgi:WD40 repeat protein